jgi:F-type H+-transporting ATPase subunit delta
VRTSPLAAARRIARALLDVAERRGDAAAVQAGLREAGALLRDHAELRSALTHPALPPARRAKLVAAVFASAPELVRRFLELLAGRDGLALLTQVEQSFTTQWNARRGVVTAEAVTAVPLERALAARLEQAIHEATGLAAVLHESTDPAILGGVLLKMGGRTYDGTVRGGLEALRRALHGEIRS